MVAFGSLRFRSSERGTDRRLPYRLPVLADMGWHHVALLNDGAFRSRPPEVAQRMPFRVARLSAACCGAAAASAAPMRDGRFRVMWGSGTVLAADDQRGGRR